MNALALYTLVFYPSHTGVTAEELGRTGVAQEDGTIVSSLANGGFELPPPADGDVVISVAEQEVFLASFIAAAKEAPAYATDPRFKETVDTYEQIKFFWTRSPESFQEVFRRVTTDMDWPHKAAYYELLMLQPAPENI